MKSFADYIVMEASTLPKEVISNIDDRIRRFFSDQEINLATMKAVEVKASDAKFKQAKIRFYLMDDEWVNRNRGQKVIVQFDENYDKFWTVNHKFTFIQNEYDYSAIKPFVKKIYVVLDDDIHNTNDIHQNRYKNNKPYRDETYNSNIELLKRGNKMLFLTNRLTDICKKYGAQVVPDGKYFYITSENKNVNINFYINDSNKLGFRIEIIKPMTRDFGTDFLDRPNETNYNNFMKKIDDNIKYLENLKLELGDIIRLAQRIIKDTEIPQIISTYNSL